MLFSDLPTEIIEQILYQLPPESFLAISQTSKGLQQITDAPLLWRHFCRTQYKYWDPRHDFTTSLTRPIENVPWKRWYVARRVLNRQVGKILDHMINNVRGRIEMMESIVNIDTMISTAGTMNLWDVKDTLLRHINCDEEAEDVLARRFWAQATLDRLHRARAIGLWAALKDENASVLLERMLAAYDMFAEGMEDADCGDVSDLVADVAQRFRNEHPQYEDLTIRERARVLAHFLRAQGFRGAQDVYYDNLPNNFITRCLRDPEHPALPIICVAIYCAVAQRLAINAAPCSFPMHVYAVVSSTDNGVDLNGRAQFSDSSPDSSPDRMYIDAFRPDVEVPLTHLAAQLSSMGASFQDRQTYLGPASHAEIVLRTSRNIMHSVKTAQNRPRTAGVYTDTQGWPDMEDALYAALWVSVLLQQRGEEGARNRMRHHLPFLCELFQNYFPWDASLLEEHILPQLLGVPEYGQMLQILSVVRAADRALKPVVRRDTDGKDKVKYRIGQVFRHRRFRYQGVIIGWDVHCDATEEWMAQMGVGEGRRWQSFYHVLAEDKSNRYVAEDNIELTDDRPSDALVRLAGRFFRSYNTESGMFVSNIREEYPDD